MEPITLNAVWYIPLFIFSILGILTVIFLTWLAIDENSHPTQYSYLSDRPKSEISYGPSKELTDIKNEITQTTKYQGYCTTDTEPTLKGRVDAIQKHLGLDIQVAPAVKEKIVVKSYKKGKK